MGSGPPVGPGSPTGPRWPRDIGAVFSHTYSQLKAGRSGRRLRRKGSMRRRSHGAVLARASARLVRWTLPPPASSARTGHSPAQPAQGVARQMPAGKQTRRVTAMRGVLEGLAKTSGLLVAAGRAVTVRAAAMRNDPARDSMGPAARASAVPGPWRSSRLRGSSAQQQESFVAQLPPALLRAQRLAQLLTRQLVALADVQHLARKSAEGELIGIQP